MLKKKSFYLNKQQNIKINFLGSKNKNFIRKFYRKTHIYILPSLSEGLSVSLTEAMSSGCICLVSKNSNHSKIISNKNGFIFNLDKKSFLKEFNKITKMKKKKYNEIRNYGYETVKALIKHGYNLRENF
jgi:glycosyltransferase involved in cell wall biosynthesis